MWMPKEVICAKTVNNVFCLKYTLENLVLQRGVTLVLRHSPKTDFCDGEKLLGPNRGVNASLFVRTLNLSLNSLPLDKWILELRTVLDIHVLLSIFGGTLKRYNFEFIYGFSILNRFYSTIVWVNFFWYFKCLTPLTTTVRNPSGQQKEAYSKMFPWFSPMHKEGNELCIIYQLIYGSVL